MEPEKKRKLIWIAGTAGVVVFTALVFISMFFLRRTGYRVIKVANYDGSVTIERSRSDVELFKGMQLIAGDTVSTGSNSWLAMLIDSDKHIGADADTTFTVHSTGNDKKGSVTIDLVSGSALFTIEEKLNEDSTFKVTTPNATLSVRGTTFIVSYNPASNTTSTTVTEGVVQATYGDGEIVELHAGEGGIIAGDEFTDRTKPYFIITRTYSRTDEPGADITEYDDDDDNGADETDVSNDGADVSEAAGRSPVSLRFAYTLRGNERRSVWSMADEDTADGDEYLAETASIIDTEYIEPHTDEIMEYMESYRASRLNQPAPDIPDDGTVSGWYLDTFTYGSTDEVDVTEWFPETLNLELEDSEETVKVTKVVMWTQVFDENLSDGVVVDAYVKELGFGVYGYPES